jgi:hypothetical protein
VFLTPYIKYERNVRNRYCTIEVKLKCKGNREKLFLKGINSFRLIFLGWEREEHGVRESLIQKRGAGVSKKIKELLYIALPYQ